MKYVFYSLLIFFIVACNSKKRTINYEEVNYKVEYKGALKNMMQKGDISAKVDLKEIENLENIYALGALENLQGEIQIFDGKPFNTMVTDSVLTFDNSFNKKATLLVFASINKWKSISIPTAVVSHEQLEKYIEQEAKKNQIDTDKPFPFLMEGSPKSFDWHVINWNTYDTVHSHDKHISSGLNGSIKNKPVKILGFYSSSHHAIFTHHTTNMHMHVKTLDNSIAGHLDEIILGKGMILKLPDTSPTSYVN